MKRIKDSDTAMTDAEADGENKPGVGPTNEGENEDDVMEDEGGGRGASKSFKSSEEARIELNCLAFQIRRIERIELIRKVRIGIKLTN
jgi:hypothetical protein